MLEGILASHPGCLDAVEALCDMYVASDKYEDAVRMCVSECLEDVICASM